MINKLISPAILLFSGLVLGFMAARYYQPSTPSTDTFWVRIEWQDQGFRIAEGGVGTYELRDNLRIIGRAEAAQELTYAAQSDPEMCFRRPNNPGQVNCIQRSSCSSLVITHENAQFQVAVSELCPVQDSELPLGISFDTPSE